MCGGDRDTQIKCKLPSVFYSQLLPGVHPVRRMPPGDFAACRAHVPQGYEGGKGRVRRFEGEKRDALYE